MPQQQWFSITNKAGSPDHAQIDIFDEIGAYGISAKDFTNQLRAISGIRKLTLNINCPGGDCLDGFAMYDAIRALDAEVTAHITGIAASMASVIMLAAQKITIAENGSVMVHRVTTGASGNHDELTAAAAIAKQLEDRIIALYIERTGKDEATIRDWMKAQRGTFFFGQAAVDAGFADSVITAKKATALKPEWAAMLTMLPRALFDSAPISSPSDLTDPSAMTEEQIIALIKQHAPSASNAELDALTGLFKEELPKALSLVLPGSIKEFTDQMSAQTAIITDLTTRLATAENLIKSRVIESAGGRSALDLGNGQGSETPDIVQQLEAITDPAARTEFFRAHKTELYAARSASQKKSA